MNTSTTKTKGSFVAFAIFILVTAAEHTDAACRVDIDGWGYEAQKWYSLDCDDPVKEITGTVSGIWLNDDDGGFFCPGPDGDWNISVKPDQPWVLKNSDGVSNPYENKLPCGITLLTWDANPTRRIELEVKSSKISRGQDLRDYFPHGTKIIAKGYWVEDSGHSIYLPNPTLKDPLHLKAFTKTELHPLTSITGGTADAFSIFVAQDTSGRFVTKDWAISENFNFSLAGDRPQWWLIPGAPQTQKLHESTIFLEEFLLDDLSGFGFCNTNTVPLNTRTRSQASASYSLYGNVSLTTFVPADQPCTVPFYLGSFTRGEFDALTETVTVSVVSGPTTDRYGQGKTGKRVEIEIKAQLAAPPVNVDSAGPDPAGLAESKWGYHSLNAATRNIESRSETQTGGHSIISKLVYWPDGGYSVRDWFLYVTGATRAESWSPTPQTGVNGPHRRAYVHDQRAYSIKPSRLALDSADINAQTTVTDPFGKLIQRLCNFGQTISVNKTGLIPGVDIPKPTWSIELIQDAEGNAVSQFIVVPAAGSVNASQAQIDNLGDAVKVMFNDLGWDLYTPGYGTYTPSFLPKNKTVLRVRTYAVTEIGEPTGAVTTELMQASCMGTPTFLPKSVLNLLDEGNKVIAALVWLSERGLLPPMPWPKGALPIERIKKENPRGLSSTPRFDEVPRRLPAEYRALPEIMLKLQKGIPLAKSDFALLDEMLRISHQLPPITPTLVAPPATPRVHTTANTRLLDNIAARLPSTNVPRKLESGQSVMLHNVAFDIGTPTFVRGASIDLQRIAHRLSRQKDKNVQVVVYPGRSVPEKLAVARANVVRDFLASKGIDAKRIATVTGKGAHGNLPSSRGSVELRVQ
jgi:hypothetical protein